jgi:ammonia channel protein AmtB
MNVLATVMQSFAVTCLVTVLWMIIGYSFAFTSGSPFLGGTSRFLLYGMTLDSVNDLAKTIPESVYMCFQMTFAIITPALICGAFADRMKFSALLWFIGCGACASIVRSPTLFGDRTGSSTMPACSTSPAAPWCTSTPALPD